MSAKLSSNKLLSVSLYAFTAEDRQRFAEEAGLGMIPPNDSTLNEIAKPVDAADSKTVQDVVMALETAARGQRQNQGKHGQKRRRTLVGLAAPQLGIPLRIILVDTHIGSDRKRYGKPQYFINPEILWRSRETSEEREGCFSAGPVWGLVRRPIAVKIRAFRPDGTAIEQVFEGFTARIVQHEIDHLNGIRFPDRIRSDRKRHWVHTEELNTYVKNIRHWRRLCSSAQWHQVKTDGVA